MFFWDKWNDCHESTDQKRRLASAQKTECTPMSIDKLNGRGQFGGSSIYTTTTENCTCGDFVRRHLPCKHMYRLAMELGIITVTTSSDITKTKAYISANSYTLEEAIEIIEAAPIESQKTLKSFLNGFLFCESKPQTLSFQSSEDLLALIDLNILDKISSTDHDLRLFGRNEINELVAPYVVGKGYKNGRSLDVQLDWIQKNIPEIIDLIGIPTVEVTLNQHFQKGKRKIYSYLFRKFSNDAYFDGEDWADAPSGSYYVASLPLDGSAITIQQKFPDDEVTRLLTKYNANRCENK